MTFLNQLTRVCSLLISFCRLTRCFSWFGVDSANIKVFPRSLLQASAHAGRVTGLPRSLSRSHLRLLAARSMWAALPEAGVTSLRRREGEVARAGKGWRASPCRCLTCSRSRLLARTQRKALYHKERGSEVPDVKAIAVSSNPSVFFLIPHHPPSSGPDPLQEGAQPPWSAKEAVPRQ